MAPSTTLLPAAMPPLLPSPHVEDTPSVLRITHLYALRQGAPLPLPLLLCRVSAGFPSPADDYAEEALDLNALLIRNPPATFMMRVSGRSMEEAGICDGDLLVVDRSVEPRWGHIVVAYLNGELAVRRVERRGRRGALVAASKDYPAIEITEAMDFAVWGVVTHVIRAMR